MEIGSYQNSKKIPKRIHSVEKAMSIINLLVENPNGLSLLEISKKLNMPKSTAHGIISTMTDFGYIEQFSINGTYRLGIRLFEAGNIVAGTMDVRKVAAPLMRELVRRLHETVYLAILKEGEVLYVDKQEYLTPFRVITEIGTRLPAHCTGVGKVLLAFVQDGELNRIFTTKGLKQYTEHTITDPIRLKQELKDIRRRGYAIDNQEIVEGLQCIAAPIRNCDNKVCAALSVSGFNIKENIQSVIDLVVKSAYQISRKMGSTVPLIERE